MANIPDPKTSSSASELDALSIIFRLKRMGLTQAGLARELEVSPAVINNVIHSRATCFAVARHISELLGYSVQELWPDRYVFKPRASHRQTAANAHEGRDTNMT